MLFPFISIIAFQHSDDNAESCNNDVATGCYLILSIKAFRIKMREEESVDTFMISMLKRIVNTLKGGRGRWLKYRTADPTIKKLKTIAMSESLEKTHNKKSSKTAF